MLSDADITEIEGVFQLIDNGVITHDTTERFLELLSQRDIERYALLNWMLNRWTILRKNKNHLPKRRVELNTCITLGLTVPDKKKRCCHKFKRGDWLCVVCNDHQFANNPICRVCNTIRLK
jgi:hypothetical protein